jgi:hypothetical protein
MSFHSDKISLIQISALTPWRCVLSGVEDIHFLVFRWIELTICPTERPLHNRYDQTPQYKGNNKITELRTILQRESQNWLVYKQTKSVNNRKTVKTIMTLTWYNTVKLWGLWLYNDTLKNSSPGWRRSVLLVENPKYRETTTDLSQLTDKPHYNTVPSTTQLVRQSNSRTLIVYTLIYKIWIYINPTTANRSNTLINILF